MNWTFELIPYDDDDGTQASGPVQNASTANMQHSLSLNGLLRTLYIRHLSRFVFMSRLLRIPQTRETMGFLERDLLDPILAQLYFVPTYFYLPTHHFYLPTHPLLPTYPPTYESTYLPTYLPTYHVHASMFTIPSCSFHSCRAEMNCFTSHPQQHTVLRTTSIICKRTNTEGTLEMQYLGTSGPIQSNPIQPNPIQPNPIQPNPIQSNPTQFAL